ncbi:MAG: hypothetical protein H8D45_29855 [Bacteroidetes bacterium]|nr:hypothetical protein [Bacteroidota bacterium]MBL7102896.1 hypothetical protein [Bacteroidales bacterium]
MYNSDEIINGIKVNDKKTWEFLYKYFYPVAKKYVTNNSGSINDAKDHLQNTFLKILMQCREGRQFSDIKTVIGNRIKWDWLDMLRTKKNITESEIKENDIKTFMNPVESIKAISSNTNFTKRFNLSKNLHKHLKKNCHVEDFLDYSNLNGIQKKMIEILLDQHKTKPVCKKLLLLTDFLPISDTRLIAEEMGYIKEHTETGIRKGLDTLSSQKVRCIKKFKEYLS